jgi:hypothetical protein
MQESKEMAKDAQMVKKVLPPEGVRGLFSDSR